jgi:hypothetical protein
VKELVHPSQIYKDRILDLISKKKKGKKKHTAIYREYTVLAIKMMRLRNTGIDCG